MKDKSCRGNTPDKNQVLSEGGWWEVKRFLHFLKDEQIRLKVEKSDIFLLSKIGMYGRVVEILFEFQSCIFIIK